MIGRLSSAGASRPREQLESSPSSCRSRAIARVRAAADDRVLLPRGRLPSSAVVGAPASARPPGRASQPRDRLRSPASISGNLSVEDGHPSPIVSSVVSAPVLTSPDLRVVASINLRAVALFDLRAVALFDLLVVASSDLRITSSIDRLLSSLASHTLEGRGASSLHGRPRDG